MTKEKPRVAHKNQKEVEERVRELKSSLQQRRAKLNDKLERTAEQTAVLRERCMFLERKEAERRERKRISRLVTLSNMSHRVTFSSK